MRDIGATLAQLRREKGLGQKQLAAILNLSVSALSSYENCVHAPDLMMLSRLAEFYDVTTDYLLGRTEYRCPPEALKKHITSDYTLYNIVDTVLTLNQERQTSVVDFVKFMKHLHDEAPAPDQPAD